MYFGTSFFLQAKESNLLRFSKISAGSLHTHTKDKLNFIFFVFSNTHLAFVSAALNTDSLSYQGGMVIIKLYILDHILHITCLVFPACSQMHHQNAKDSFGGFFFQNFLQQTYIFIWDFANLVFLFFHCISLCFRPCLLRKMNNEIHNIINEF